MPELINQRGGKEISYILAPYENAIHDIKTPMSIIYSNLQLLEANPKIPEESQIQLQVIKNNWYKAMKLINDVNDTAKMSNGFMMPKLSNANIVEVIKTLAESTQSFADRKNIEISFDSDMPEKIMAMDRSIIERIMLNLLSNAIKFTDRGGKVEVLVKDGQDHIQLIVKDNGMGMDEEERKYIFSRYQSVDHKSGSGIGLSIVRDLTNLLNGSIIVHSSAGAGTEMIVELPVIVLDDMDIELKLYDDFYQDNIVQIELSDYLY